MACADVLECLETDLANLERVKYFPRQLLTADDMIADQEYFREKLRRHNRFLHGWGVVCGLEVTPASTAAQPSRVQISPGYALAPNGEEIYVGQPVFLDLARCGPGASTDPCEPDRLRPGSGRRGQRLYIAVCYAQCYSRPVRSMPGGCGCDETACEYSRIRDSFTLECFEELPPSHRNPDRPNLCEARNRGIVWPCPPCSDDPCVVLALATFGTSSLPSFSAQGVNINNSVRRMLYGTAVLQEQIIACCCGERPQGQLADLAVTQTITMPAAQLDTVFVQVTVRNLGPDPAQNVRIEDRFRWLAESAPTAPNLLSSNWSPNWTQIPTQGPLVAILPQPLAANAQVVLSFQFKGVSDNIFRFALENTAEASTSTPESTQTNNKSVQTFGPLEASRPPR